MKRLSECWKRVCQTRRISPGGFVLYAALAALVCTVLHLLGLREYVSIASGTPPSLFGSEELGIGLGIAYVLFYLAAVVAAPILLFAAGVWLLGRRILSHWTGAGVTAEAERGGTR